MIPRKKRHSPGFWGITRVSIEISGVLDWSGVWGWPNHGKIGTTMITYNHHQRLRRSTELGDLHPHREYVIGEHDLACGESPSLSRRSLVDHTEILWCT